MKKPKFKDRYVLGEGYPFQDTYETVVLFKTPYDANEWQDEATLKFPRSIMKKDCPKYRLVLERIR